jgi:hypothetical protein
MRKLIVGVAVIGLSAAAAPQSASAQQPQVIYDCKTTTGTLFVVAASTKCPNNEPLLSWNVTGPQGPPGQNGLNGSALAAAQFVCLNQTTNLPIGDYPIVFTTPANAAGNFGTSISLPPNTTSSTQILLGLSGSYLIDVSIDVYSAGPQLPLAGGGLAIVLNGNYWSIYPASYNLPPSYRSLPQIPNPQTPGYYQSFHGTTLISASNNTTLNIVYDRISELQTPVSFGPQQSFNNGTLDTNFDCKMTITQIH